MKYYKILKVEEMDKCEADYEEIIESSKTLKT